MALCRFDGNDDMYGLGIRLGYYLQWFGVILAAWMAPSEVKGLRFSLDLFVAASFLALVILTARDVNSLEPVETYIVLLLMFGTYIALVPIYLWRILTRCDPYWDPTRYPLVRQSEAAANMSYILLIGVLVFQYWFWFAQVPSLNRRDCQEYGFLFAQARLNGTASVVINAMLYVTLGLVCLYLFVLKLRHFAGLPDPSEGRRRRTSKRHKRAHIELLRNIDGWFKFLVAISVTLATELTIQWNEIGGVNSLAGAGQTIPFVIGLGLFIRVLYVALQEEEDGSFYGSDSEYTYSSHRPVPSRQLPSTRISHERPAAVRYSERRSSRG